MKILKIDGTVTVITDKGDVITASNVSEETFKQIYAYVQAGNEEGIKQLLVPELCDEERKFIAKKHAVENIYAMAQHLPHLFEIKNHALYRIGIDLSIPEELALEYVESYNKHIEYSSIEDGFIMPFEDTYPFQRLDRFWMWCSLNPNAESREDLFRFLQHHEMQITNQGMFLAYRRVVTKSGANTGLINFVSNAYVRVKTKLKKKAKDYFVYEKDGMFEVSTANKPEATLLGNLEELYLNLPNLQESQFTDAHTHTMDYRIGVEARIERHQGNQSNQVSCSRGLHVASKAYDYSGFGDTAILVAVNPMDVLAVPRGEDGKLRTCAFTPVAVLEKGEENKFLQDDDVEVDDLLFAHYEEQVNKLEEMLSNNTAYELNVNHILNAPNQYMLSNILHNLKSAEEIINKRISHI